MTNSALVIVSLYTVILDSLKPGVARAPTFFRPPLLMILAALTRPAASIACSVVFSTAVLCASETAGRKYHASKDFAPAGEPFATYYAETKVADTSLHGLAVNPKQVADRFAAAEITFDGPPGKYAVRVLAVAEEDGESVYELHVGKENHGRKTNPVVKEKRVPVTHVWEPVTLAPGTRVRVLFAGRSNGRYPEGDAFAWSRGRWRTLEIVPLTEASK